jgi:hypothetical protein
MGGRNVRKQAPRDGETHSHRGEDRTGDELWDGRGGLRVNRRRIFGAYP